MGLFDSLFGKSDHQRQREREHDLRERHQNVQQGDGDQ